MKHMRTVTIEGRKLPYGVKKLRTLTIASMRIPVVRGTVEQFPELQEPGRLLDAFFCPERMIIVVRAGQAPTQERDSIVHEGVHAFIHVTGIGHLLKRRFKKEKAADRFEEELVRVATPHIVAMGVFS